MNNQDTPKTMFFSIHSIESLKNKQFSIVRANIDNTPDKVKLAKELYPEKDWHIEYHNERKNMKPVYSPY